MSELYLIGGGWNEDSFQQTFGRFVKAGTQKGICKILLILACEDLEAREEVTEDFSKMFHLLGNVEIEPFYLSEGNILTREILSSLSPTCVFVGGGLTPLYQEYLGTNREFIDYVNQNHLPYGGFSAGAAIAAKSSIVGGWKINESGKDIPVLDEDFSEDLDYIEIRKGLGFFPYPVDVHGSQWGTLTRVIHAVDQKLIPNGCVVDESTMIESKHGMLTVFGHGQVYFVGTKNNRIEISIFKDGETIR